MTRLAFLDTETTGLHRERHEMWELAYVIWDSENGPLSLENCAPVKHWQFPVSLQHADLIALNIGGYFERCKAEPNSAPYTIDHEGCAYLRDHDSDLKPHVTQFQSTRSAAKEIFNELQGVHMVGAVPDFDSHFLRKFLLTQGYCESWNYHLVCVENLLAGALQVQPPWKSEELYERIGLTKEYPGKHTAYGDVMRNIEVYRAVMYGFTFPDSSGQV